MYILHYNTFLPACRAAKILLDECKIEYSANDVDYLDSMHEPSTDCIMLPVLTDERAHFKLKGIYAISEFVAEELCADFFSKDSYERAEVRKYIEFSNNYLGNDVAAKIVFEKFYKRVLSGGYPDSKVIREAGEKLQTGLEHLEERLQKSSWIALDKMTIADFCVFAALSILDYFAEIDWKRFSHLKEWYGVLKSRPSARYVLTERLVGANPPEYYENPDF